MRLIPNKTYYTKEWYSTYRAMMDRCYRKEANNYDFYGGRGIKVCPEWHDIQTFELWVEKSGFQKGLSIERINVNEDYSPNNCRWATPKEQANNRRNTVYIEYRGERHTITEWADILGINRSTLNNRVYRGWESERIFKGVRKYGKTN